MLSRANGGNYVNEFGFVSTLFPNSDTKRIFKYVSIESQAHIFTGPLIKVVSGLFVVLVKPTPVIFSLSGRYADCVFVTGIKY